LQGEKTINDALEAFFRTEYGQSMTQETSGFLAERLERLMPPVCLGLGYLPPYADGHKEAFKNTFWLVNRALRASPWPEDEESARALVADEYLLPFENESVDTVLVLHSLEFTPHYIDSTLREIWRVLKAGGRIFIVTARKFGLLPFVAGDLFTWSKLWPEFLLNRKLANAGFERITSTKIADFSNKPNEAALFRLWGKCYKNVLVLEAQKVVASPIGLAQTPLNGRLGPVGTFN
jgi:SAM-dependent methyltransferase